MTVVAGLSAVDNNGTDVKLSHRRPAADIASVAAAADSTIKALAAVVDGRPTRVIMVPLVLHDIDAAG